MTPLSVTICRYVVGSILLLALLTCWFALPSRALAQTVTPDTGAIEGFVADGTGRGLAGVTVTLASDALMRPRSDDTDERGRFYVYALPPGRYTVDVVSPGFAAIRRSLDVAAAFTATVDVVLSLAPVDQQVSVRTNSSTIDQHSTTVVTRFDDDQLASLPGSRSMAAVLAATPAVFVNRFDVGGSAGVVAYGTFGTTGNNRPMVEGIDTTGISATGFSFDVGSFSEVLVSTAAHATEWPKPGVQMLFLSKSGGDRLGASAYLDYQHRDWQSFNIDASQVARSGRSGPPLSRDANRLWSYSDLNADAGGPLMKGRLWWYGSTRRQQTAVRYVNFPVEPHETANINYSAKTTMRVAVSQFLFYGQAGQHHQPTRLDPSGLTALNANTAIHSSRESTIDQDGWGWVWKAEWNAVLKNTLFAEVRGGQFGTNRRERPNGDAPRFEDLTSLAVRGGSRDLLDQLRREQLFAAASYVPRWRSGAHHLKGGAEVLRSTESETVARGAPGDVLHLLRNGAPSEVVLFQAPGLASGGLWTWAGYLHDTWRVTDRITVDAGLRLDRFRLFFPEQQRAGGRFAATPLTFPAVPRLGAWTVLAPRLGLAMDLSGTGATIIKASYSRYRGNPGVATALNANPNAGLWWRRYGWSDANGNGLWDPGEEMGEPMTRGGVALESLDPRLDLTLVQETIGSIERQLAGAVGLRAGIAWRRESRQFLRQNVTLPPDAFSERISIIDPGPDNIPATNDDGPPVAGYQLDPSFLGPSAVNVVRNVSNAGGQYWSADASANRRFDGRWSLGAGASHVWSEDQASGYFGQPTRQNVYAVTPNDRINADARGRYHFRLWSAKAYGTFVAPYRVRVSPLLRHQSGQPFGRTFSASLNYANNVRVLAEPIGTRRMDNVTLIDLRVERTFPVNPTRRVALFFDVYNLLNTNAEQNISWSSGSFLQPLNVVGPRIARVGAKLHW